MNETEKISDLELSKIKNIIKNICKRDFAFDSLEIFVNDSIKLIFTEKINKKEF